MLLLLHFKILKSAVKSSPKFKMQDLGLDSGISSLDSRLTYLQLDNNDLVTPVDADLPRTLIYSNRKNQHAKL